MTAHLLISFPVPVIESIYHLPAQADVKLLVKKGSGTDFLFSVVLAIFKEDRIMT